MLHPADLAAREEPASRRASPARARILRVEVPVPRVVQEVEAAVQQQSQHLEPVGRPNLSQRALAGDARRADRAPRPSPRVPGGGPATCSASRCAPGRSSPFAGSPGSPTTRARSLSRGRAGRERGGAVLGSDLARQRRAHRQRHLRPAVAPHPREHLPVDPRERAVDLEHERARPKHIAELGGDEQVVEEPAELVHLVGARVGHLLDQLVDQVASDGDQALRDGRGRVDRGRADPAAVVPERDADGRRVWAVVGGCGSRGSASRSHPCPGSLPPSELSQRQSSAPSASQARARAASPAPRVSARRTPTPARAPSRRAGRCSPRSRRCPPCRA